MKKSHALLALATTLVSIGAAHADCPSISGRYTYTCTVTRDEDADLGAMLETSGQMVVDQQACDAYRFTETVKNEMNVIDLNNVDSRHDEFSTKIRKSNSRKLRFRSARAPDVHSAGEVVAKVITLENYVTRATIVKTRKGFKMKGKELSKILGIFWDNHSKFDCKFDRI